MSPRHVVMFVYNDARTDARVWREAGTLTRNGLVVRIIALGGPGLADREAKGGITLIRVTPPRRGIAPGTTRSPYLPHSGGGWTERLRWLWGYGMEFDGWRRGALEALSELPLEARDMVWHGHDLTGLVVADGASRRHGGALVYDSHELYVEAGSAARLPGLARWLLGRFERRMSRRATAVITVNDSIAKELATRYGVRQPAVVMNCPPVPDAPAARLTSPLRAVLGLGGRPILLHHGGLSAGRGIRQAVSALRWLPEEVALVLLGNGELVPELTALAAEEPYRSRLFLHPAVPIDELGAWVAGADIGVITFEAVDKNNYYGTPNKLFECLAGGVPVVVSDFPEMRRVVEQDSVGLTCDPSSPKSIAGAVRTLLEETDEVRQDRRARCHQTARDTYSWEAQEQVLLDVYGRFHGSEG